jgi:hypothetical protein
MELEAVELHDQPPVEPHRVHLVSGDVEIHDRRRKPGLVTEVEKIPLELRPGRRRAVTVAVEHAPQRSQRMAPATALHQPLDRGHVEQPQALCLLEGAREAALIDDLGEVEQRPGDGGHRDAVEHGALTGMQRAHQVHVDVGVPVPAAAENRDVDRSAGARAKIPERSGIPMAGPAS